MTYCPSCKSEYRDTVKTCPDCGVDLRPTLEETAVQEDWLDVYVCYDLELAEHVMLSLRDSGLAPMLRDRRDLAFPTTIGTTNELRIALPAHEQARGIKTLLQALADGVLAAEDGEVMEPRAPA